MIESDELSYPEEVHHEALFMHDEGVIYKEKVMLIAITMRKQKEVFVHTPNKNFGTKNGQNCKCF